MADSITARIGADDADFVAGMRSAAAAGAGAAAAISRSWTGAATSIAVAGAAGFVVAEASANVAEMVGVSGTRLSNFDAAWDANARRASLWGAQVEAGRRSALELADALLGPLVRGWAEARVAMTRYHIDLFQGAGAAAEIEEAAAAARMSGVRDLRADADLALDVELLRARGDARADDLQITLDHRRAVAEIAAFEKEHNVVLRAQRAALLEIRDLRRAALEEARRTARHEEQLGLEAVRVSVLRARGETTAAEQAAIRLQTLRDLVAMDRLEHLSVLERSEMAGLILEREDALLEAMRRRHAEEEAAEERRRADLRFRAEMDLGSIDAQLLRLQGDERGARALEIELETRRRIREIEGDEALSETERADTLAKLEEIRRLRLEGLDEGRETTRVVDPVRAGFDVSLVDRSLGLGAERNREMERIAAAQLEKLRQLLDAFRDLPNRLSIPRVAVYAP